MATPLYQLVQDLTAASSVPPDGILSRTLLDAPHAKVVLFTFAEGQRLSEHTASTPADLYFIQGAAEVSLGVDTVEARAGTWIHMTAGLPHAIAAKTPVTLLLTLFKTPQSVPTSSE